MTRKALLFSSSIGNEKQGGGGAFTVGKRVEVAHNRLVPVFDTLSGADRGNEVEQAEWTIY